MERDDTWFEASKGKVVRKMSRRRAKRRAKRKCAIEFVEYVFTNPSIQTS